MKRINKIMSILNAYRAPVITLLMVVFVSACSTAGGPVDSGQKLSSEPLTGKFVWHDLVTDNINVSRDFYSGLFGWEFENSTRPGGAGPYVLVRSGGKLIAGMVELADPEGATDYSRWLGYISVIDVDASAKKTSIAGGQVVITPRNLGKFARVAVVRDPQGAVFGLARSHAGDPVDGQQKKAGHVVWNELLAADSEKAGAFYRSLMAYEVKTISRRGGEYTMLRSSGMDRAGILQRPVADIEPLWLTYFAVSDPVKAAKRVEQLGGKVLLPPSDDFREGTVALVTDPSGAVLALQKWPL